MTTEEKKQLSEICSRFRKEDLIISADTHYKGSSWDVPIIHQYTVNDLLIIINKLFLQFDVAITSSDFSVYPIVYSDSTYGQNSVITELQNVVAWIAEKRALGEFLSSINWLKNYLLVFNLWNTERLEPNLEEIENKQFLIHSLFETIKRELNSVETLKNEILAQQNTLISERDTFNQFLELKKQEMQVISESIPIITNQKNEADSILKNVQQTNSEIRAIKENHGELFEQLKNQKDAQEKDFKGAIDRFVEEEVKLKATILSGDEKIKHFNSLDEFINMKRSEIIRLTGLAADGSLGHTFNARKTELNSTVNFWRTAIPLMTFFTVFWIAAIFTNFFDKDYKPTFELSVVILNVVKTLPAFILLGFTVNQYTKERNLQEEYAFKAAVAMTISAYSDKLEDKKNKEALIMDSVKNIYCTPKIQIEKSGNVFSFRTKPLNETIKNLTEAIKEIKK